ncbi:hypothetical protein HU200_045034 [Digitaria exilis]|uniref:Uncharacterized protein n=1 Tax=Digitaria exilis TaxID=1010633 RepID=A0A835ECE4_9POAL|nr:hypothetical protein HU200_045034 [Digitaria exilis]CAB3498660.1 unnamed protein product [Digitaria exilis]
MSVSNTRGAQLLSPTRLINPSFPFASAAPLYTERLRRCPPPPPNLSQPLPPFHRPLPSPSPSSAPKP